MAKTAGKISGNLILVSIGGVTVTCSTNASLDITIEAIKTSCKDDDGQETNTPGGLSGSLQCDLITKFDTASSLSLILAAAFNKTVSEYRYGGLGNADDPYIQFDGFITNVKWDGPLNNPSNISFTAVPSTKMLLFNS